MSNPILLAIAIGLFFGAFLGYWSSKTLAFRLSKRSIAPRFVLACSAVGAFLIMLPAFYISFIVGGNLGGGWGEAAGKSMGFGSVGVPIGLGAGIAIVFGSGLAIGALAGGLIGKLLTYALPKSALTNHSRGTR